MGHRAPIGYSTADRGKPQVRRLERKAGARCPSACGGRLLYPDRAARVRAMSKMKIAVTGAAGRMGRELIRTIHGREDCVVAGAIEQEGSIALGQDIGLLAGLGKLGVLITDDPLELFAKVDGVLDFTIPKATVEFAGLAANARIVHVYGTTGLEAGGRGQDRGRSASRHHHHRRQHEPGRQPVDGADAQGRRGAGPRLRHRDPGDAPPPQGRCPLGYGLDAGQGGRRGPGREVRERQRARARRPHGSARAATSASPRCAAAATSASTR